MILQCDQCQTKFRLDDSKLKPGGVKVRCSKCRHVFVAGAEPKQEESDFDAILAGLGAPAPEATGEPAAPAGEEAEFGFGAETEAPAAEEKGAAPEAAGAPSLSEADFPDFSSFDFPAESAAPKQQPAAVPEEGGFGDFDFGTEPEPAAAHEEAPAAPSGLEFQEFSFEEVAPAAKERPSKEQAEAPNAAAGEFDFGELSFDAEPAPSVEEEAAAPASGLDFGEFEFNPEPAVKAPEAPSAPAAPELDFGEFSFNEEPAAKEAEPAAKEPFDFGEFSFEEEPPPLKETPAAGTVEELGAFSFSEEAPQKEEPAPAAAEEFALPGFSFEQEVQKKEEKPVAPAPEEEFALGEFSFAEEAPPKQDRGAQSQQPQEFDFGDFSFTEEAPGAPGAHEGAAPAEAGFAAGGGIPAGPAPTPETEPTPPEAPAPAQTPSASAEKASAKAPDFNFDFGTGPVPGKAEGFEQEELPPLSIPSRRKGRSLVSVAVGAIAVLGILAVSVSGLYLLQKGPAAAQTFNKVGLGFVGKWFGVETPEEGRIIVRNPQASFYQNKEAGELFVVTGEAVNNFKTPRASVHVKVTLFDKKGGVLMQKTAYCGNRLSKEQLETLPLAKIESIMNNQFGDSLSNLGVKPGQPIGFVVAIANAPKEAADFAVEVAGSTVAGQ